VIDDGHVRCWPVRDDIERAYHDQEWGRPVRDDARLLEKISLEGFQSGLSWDTILRKRPGFRAAFGGFDPEVLARYGAVGVVNDHLAACFVRDEVEALRVAG
jgi:DNA-3-methyladenine glycosylase I